MFCSTAATADAAAVSAVAAAAAAAAAAVFAACSWLGNNLLRSLPDGISRLGNLKQL
jgi:hypothetical protein